MTKAENQADPASCWNKAKDDEEVFILLARDPEAAATIRFWANRRILNRRNDKDDEQILNAFEVANKIENAHVAKRLKEQVS